MDIQPVQYLRQNTNPELVVSSVVAAFALGGALALLRYSGIRPIQQLAKIPTK